MQKQILISIVNLKCHSAIRNGGECNSVWKTIYLSCKQMSITDNQTFLQYSINSNIWVNEQCVHQSEEWLSVNVKIPISILNRSLICNRDLGGISVGYKASSEPPYASHTLVQIILHFIPKLSTQSILLKSYFRLIVCKWPYFYKKLRKHCFGARCWYKHAKSSNFNGLQDNRYLKARPHGPNESISKRHKSHLHMSAGLYI